MSTLNFYLESFGFEHSCHNKEKLHWETCYKAFHIKKFFFYYLPTQGRAGIKLGDAWYVSNVSIIFDCSMLLYYLFWILMGLFLHFYIIFGTNLLTEGPVQFAVFFAYFSVSHKRNIKRSPNGMKPVISHLGAFSGAPPEGESITEGFYINTIASPMMCE